MRKVSALFRRQKRAFSSQRLTQTQKTAVVFLAGTALAATAFAFHSKQNVFVESVKAPELLASTTVLADEKRDYANIQSTVITGTHPHCAIVTINLAPNADRKQVLKACAQIDKICAKLSPKSDANDDELPPLMIGVGFDTKLWEGVAKDSGGKIKLTPAQHYKSRKGMPATPSSILLHVKGNTFSLCYESVQEFLASLPKDSVAKVADEYGFQYKDGRDLSGFLDGTMNSSGDEERFDNAVTPTGGSFVVHQIWQHDLEKLKTFKVEQQEAMIGRKKDWSSELSPLAKDSHVARCRDNNGERILIVRQSMPFGHVASDKTKGLLFIAYANSVAKFDKMLDKMSGESDGVQDAVLKFSTAKTGNYFYFPSKKELANL